MANQYTKKYTLENIKAPKDIWRRIRRAITERPDLHAQEGWHTEHGPGYPIDVNYSSEKQILSCDTMHCVAGWGSVLTPGGVQVEIKQGHDAAAVFTAALQNAGKLGKAQVDISNNRNKLYDLFYNLNKDEAAAKVAEFARQEARDEKNAKLRAKRRAAKRA